MARRKSRIDDTVILFDVIYEDGTRSSRRRVPASEMPDHDGDGHARTVIMAQDRKISDMSGRDRGAIRSITRSAI